MLDGSWPEEGGLSLSSRESTRSLTDLAVVTLGPPTITWVSALPPGAQRNCEPEFGLPLDIDEGVFAVDVYSEQDNAHRALLAHVASALSARYDSSVVTKRGARVFPKTWVLHVGARESSSLELRSLDGEPVPQRVLHVTLIPLDEPGS